MHKLRSFSSESASKNIDSKWMKSKAPINIIVAGSGTGVGKTIISAILTVLFKGSYWKPIECGSRKNADTTLIKKWIHTLHSIYPPAYSLKMPLSPHHAARLENISIQPEAIIPPQSSCSLIIESVGGIFTPLTPQVLSIELFKKWQYPWIIISRHYLGSINHTLLTITALKQFKVPLLGIIFNGACHPDSEKVILEISKLPFLARLLPESRLNLQTIQRYAKQWQHQFAHLLP